MASSVPGSFHLTGTSRISLNERFSQVLVDQLTRSRKRPFDPALRIVSRPLPQVRLVNRDLSSLPHPQADGPQRVRQHLRRRRSVWTRLGGQPMMRRLSAFTPQGFWSFRNKYKWRSRFSFRYRRRRNLNSGVARRRLLRTTLEGQRQMSVELQRSRKNVPTRQQLDAQLDDYMSMSRRRLDQQLDEYMSMAGQTTLLWEEDGEDINLDSEDTETPRF